MGPLKSQLGPKTSQDYSTTIIGVPDRRYLWIMARTPQMEEAKLDALIAKSRSLGGHGGTGHGQTTWEPNGNLFNQAMAFRFCCAIKVIHID